MICRWCNIHFSKTLDEEPMTVKMQANGVDKSGRLVNEWGITVKLCHSCWRKLADMSGVKREGKC
jgi:hypothetical protein